MTHVSASALLALGLFIVPVLPASAQSVDFGPGGIRVDPRSPRERDRDEIRREERREDLRDAERRDERRRRDLDDDGPPPRRY